MTKNLYGNCHAEKLEFLPEEFEIDVTKTWCLSVISELNQKEDYGDLLYMINMYVNNAELKSSYVLHSNNYVTMMVGDIKKIINICGAGSLCCMFPYDYDQIADNFLCSKLGGVKIQIDLLVSENKINEALELINNILNDYNKRLALLYLKSIYNTQTETLIIEFKNSRRRVINTIDSILYY